MSKAKFIKWLKNVLCALLGIEDPRLAAQRETIYDLLATNRTIRVRLAQANAQVNRNYGESEDKERG